MKKLALALVLVPVLCSAVAVTGCGSEAETKKTAEEAKSIAEEAKSVTEGEGGEDVKTVAEDAKSEAEDAKNEAEEAIGKLDSLCSAISSAYLNAEAGTPIENVMEELNRGC